MDRKDITKDFLFIRNSIIKRYNHFLALQIHASLNNGILARN